MVENIRVAGGEGPRGPHIMGTPFHWQNVMSSADGILSGIQLDVIAYEKIQVSVAGRNREKWSLFPSGPCFPIKACLASNIGKKVPLAVVMKEDVMAPEAGKIDRPIPSLS